MPGTPGQHRTRRHDPILPRFAPHHAVPSRRCGRAAPDTGTRRRAPDRHACALPGTCGPDGAGRVVPIGSDATRQHGAMRRLPDQSRDETRRKDRAADGHEAPGVAPMRARPMPSARILEASREGSPAERPDPSRSRRRRRQAGTDRYSEGAKAIPRSGKASRSSIMACSQSVPPHWLENA